MTNIDTPNVRQKKGYKRLSQYLIEFLKNEPMYVSASLGIIISLILAFVVEFYNATPTTTLPEFIKNNLSTNALVACIGALVGLIHGFRKEFNDKMIYSVRNAFNDQTINITGVHRGKPAGAALIANAELFNSDPKDHFDGLLIMKHHAFEPQYASHCNKVIEHNGIRSIYSMSDFGLDLTFHMFCKAQYDDNEDIIKWIQAVNKAKKTEIKRIQVLTEGRYQFLKKLIVYKQDNAKWKDLIENVRPLIRRQYEKNNVSLIEDEGNAKLLANNLLNGYEWYCKNYAFVDLEEALKTDKIKQTEEHVNWAVYARESIEQGTGIELREVTPGEFIVFNEDMLVRYSADSRLSETLTGQIVEPFLVAFTDNVCWEKQIGLRPLFFGHGLYGKSAKKGKYFE